MALPRYQQGAVRLLVGSVVIGALLGIYALVVSEPGVVELKLLGTSFSISGACLLCVACGAAWGRGRLAAAAPVGVAAALLGFGILIILMWAEADSEDAWRAALTLIILATAATYAALIGLARLPGSLALLMGAAVTSGGALAAIWLGILWDAIEPSTALWRLVGVLSICLAALTILVPVFHRLRGRPSPADSGTQGARFCPHCGQPVDEALPGRCLGCGRRFHVTYFG